MRTKKSHDRLIDTIKDSQTIINLILSLLTSQLNLREILLILLKINHDTRMMQLWL